MSKTRYIQKEYSDLIHEELEPQFLGLWVEMQNQGIPADIAKRAMASALFKPSSYLRETHNLAGDDEILKMIKEIHKILAKYEDNGMHYGRISAVLEFLVTIVLGTKSREDDDD